MYSIHHTITTPRVNAEICIRYNYEDRGRCSLAVATGWDVTQFEILDEESEPFITIPVTMLSKEDRQRLRSYVGSHLTIHLLQQVVEDYEAIPVFASYQLLTPERV